MNPAKLSLMLVVLVDVMGQGLAFPIFNTLMMQADLGFLPASTSESARRLNYGLVIGVFFTTWFLGAVYVSRISDSIGRKKGIILCLTGSFTGYLLTIVAMASNSLWLLLASRAITGFTAGTQSIAQAAMADVSTDDADKGRNMGFIVAGAGIGLVVGPVIGGVFSDPNLLGSDASLALPFYVGGALNLFAAAMILVFFHDVNPNRLPLRINPLDVVRLILDIGKHPTVCRVTILFFLYMAMLITAYIFLTNYLSSRFGLDTAGTSVGVLIFGASFGVTSTFLVGPFQERMSRKSMIVFSAVTMIASIALLISAPNSTLAYLAFIPFGIAHGIGAPALFALYSSSVDETLQGWVMGVSVAMWTLAAGLNSFIGGELLTFGIRNPFLLSMGYGVLLLVAIFIIGRSDDIRRISGRVVTGPKSETE
ncbi:MAG: MFS transporter [Roseibium sp.]|uniref:MFS transporter n=1 Tax=Roseibium sp. TaxID=1936156 RepID=UPI00263883AF|nr:MFS transporter [Roseibium sp.]MCV0425617.1 MFS transporter [Roseibium sp.]